MKYRIKIVTYKNEKVKFFAQYRSFWTLGFWRTFQRYTYGGEENREFETEAHCRSWLDGYCSFDNARKKQAVEFKPYP